jgi:serine protease AprX
MKTFYTFTFFILLSGLLCSQVAPDKYWVKFTDKNNSPYSINNPELFLSQKAIDRRNSQGISIAENDLPVNPSYIQAVSNLGATILNVSKWMNSVTVYTTSPAVINAIEQLPFVLSVEKSNISSTSLNEKSIKPFFDAETYAEFDEENLVKSGGESKSYDYGMAFNQINMLNGIALHNLGYNGTGMTIAVLDAGFLNANTLAAFNYLWTNNRILGYKDFADPLNPNIFGSHTHGTSVLSTMGANLPGAMVGTAPEASYWLLRSEDGGSEYLIEELNWVSAAEFADSVGADVINSSLGYTTFNDPSQNHTYADMDGNTTPVSIGADIAVSKGMIVVNSAGNDGSSSWFYIGAPADGDSVFSIGAVNASGNYASFSSHGPTSDGQIKPDVVAQGSGTTIINASSGNVTTGSGTSFSSPVTAGMVTSLWQAHPNRRNTEILEAIRQSGSLATNPNYQLGYGIPNYLTAHNNLLLPVNYNFSLSLKLFLEGPFDVSNMNTDLNSSLPLTQPYNIEPFNYSGTESVLSIPGTDIVDWILVELRDASSPQLATSTTMIEQKAAFLKADGSVVGLDGTSNLQFNVSVTDKAYLVIHHRNHLGVLAFYPLIIHDGFAAYDFTTGAVKSYGSVAGTKEITSGAWGMIAGDGNADGTIDDTDKLSEWELNAGEKGYLPGDYNMDGQVNNPDKDNIWVINSGYNSQLP